MLRPLRDYLLVKQMERVKSDVIHVAAEEKPNFGVVKAVGPGKIVKGKRKTPDVVVGDLVRFGTAEGYLSFPVHREGGEEFLILQEADVCWVQSAT